MRSNSDWVMRFCRCPRCGANGLEILKEHSYCVDCNYCPDIDERRERPVPEWALQVLRGNWNGVTPEKESHHEK